MQDLARDAACGAPGRAAVVPVDRGPFLHYHGLRPANAARADPGTVRKFIYDGHSAKAGCEDPGGAIVWEGVMNLRPDPTFYPSPKLAMAGPVETLAYTLMLSPDASQPDGLAVVDVDPGSTDFGKIVHKVIMPHRGDEFHHFGWNACSSSLSPLTGHAFLGRRCLIVPGIRSSRI